ncbi:Hypothetical protein POVN_LOCUS406 [uncultured virus]|nr:Hypothetical protein POVN_LOCUS406 [uncultured virus]
MTTDPIALLVDLGERFQGLRKEPDKIVAEGLAGWLDQKGLDSLATSIKGFLQGILDTPEPVVRPGEPDQPYEVEIGVHPRLSEKYGFPEDPIKIVVPPKAKVHDVVQLLLAKLKDAQKTLDYTWELAHVYIDRVYLYDGDVPLNEKDDFGVVYASGKPLTFDFVRIPSPGSPLKLTVTLDTEALPFLPYLDLKNVTPTKDGFIADFKSGSKFEELRRHVADLLNLHPRSITLEMWVKRGAIEGYLIPHRNEIFNQDSRMVMGFTQMGMLYMKGEAQKIAA